jgi:hypothetical protein
MIIVTAIDRGSCGALEDEAEFVATGEAVCPLHLGCVKSSKQRLNGGLAFLQLATHQQNVTSMLSDENAMLRQINAKLRALLDGQAVVNNSAGAAFAEVDGSQRGMHAGVAGTPTANTQLLSSSQRAPLELHTPLGDVIFDSRFLIIVLSGILVAALCLLISCRLHKGPVNLIARTVDNVSDDVSTTCWCFCGPCMLCYYAIDGLDYRTQMMLIFIVTMTTAGFVLVCWLTIGESWQGIARLMYVAGATMIVPILLIQSVVICETFVFFRDAADFVEEGAGVVTKQVRRAWKATSKEIHKDANAVKQCTTSCCSGISR